MRILKGILSTAAKNLLREPKTTVAGIVTIIGGIAAIKSGNPTTGITAILSGIPLILADDPKKVEKFRTEN